MSGNLADIAARDQALAADCPHFDNYVDDLVARYQHHGEEVAPILIARYHAEKDLVQKQHIIDALSDCGCHFYNEVEALRASETGVFAERLSDILYKLFNQRGSLGLLGD